MYVCSYHCNAALQINAEKTVQREMMIYYDEVLELKIA